MWRMESWRGAAEDEEKGTAGKQVLRESGEELLLQGRDQIKSMSYYAVWGTRSAHLLSGQVKLNLFKWHNPNFCPRKIHRNKKRGEGGDTPRQVLFSTENAVWFVSLTR